MRSRLAMFTAIAVAVAAVAFTIVRFVTAPSEPPVARASLPIKLASYLGVFENGSPPSYVPLDDFAKAAGRSPSLVGYYSGWVEPFQLRFAESVHAHGAIPFVQIDPTLASISGIADGVYDSYLGQYADSVRRYGFPVVIGFGHEMNASWYPWGYKHVSPVTFKAAWRHIVDLFRARGARNVTWLWTVNALKAPGAPAAAGGIGPLRQWWPGQDYVTWVGVDGFYYNQDNTFNSVFGPTIRQVRQFTNQPVLLSETAVGPLAGQFLKIQNLFNGMVSARTLGLVWFDNAQHAGIFHQDWRIEDNQSAQISFRLGVRDDLRPAPGH
jgi:Glycosyl hydrolase family 26